MRGADFRDAVVVGAGPNGLAAAILLARSGLSVRVLEGKSAAGGALRCAPLTLPGFVHDVGSALHPLGLGSPFFRSLPLAQHGLEWIEPPSAVAHPFDDGSAAVLQRSCDATADSLGEDGPAYRRLLEASVRNWKALAEDLLAPPGIPNHPLVFARFARFAAGSARALAEGQFRGDKARALFGGLAAHGSMPLERPLTAAFGLVLSILGHAVGWPLPRGGAQSLANALVGHLASLGGEVLTDAPVRTLAELSTADVAVLDVTPRQLLSLAEDRLPEGYSARLRRHRYGPGVFKLDWALRGPIPWRAPECSSAGAVHLGGTLREIAASERAVWAGEVPERPYVIVVQPSLFDASRAPAGCHTAWAYCHVPNGSAVDATGKIEAQIERFAPGFGDLVLARHALSPAGLEKELPNCIGGDIGGGILDVGALLAGALGPNPYRTPIPGVYLCSASTPPGGGVHGMCGFYAAQTVLRDLPRGTTVDTTARRDLPPLPVVPHVDLQRYIGTWYEIARYPNRFQRGCFGSRAIYSLRPDGRISVLNECRRGNPAGPISSARGTARVVDPETSARLKVSFFWPFSGDYWIIDLGESYDYAVVSGPERKYLWILSRSRQMDPQQYGALLEGLRAKGFDTQRLVLTPRWEGDGPR